jgi:hypothetical protein
MNEAETRSHPGAAVESPDAGSLVDVDAISPELVRIYTRFYGRGPTKAKTGHFERVRANREAFQEETASLFRGTVESITRRAVASFLSQTDRDGVTVEVFLLAGSAPADPEA